MFIDETTKVRGTDYVEPFSIELEQGTRAVKQRTYVLQTLSGSKCFSTLDASQACMNIPVREDCQSMIAYVCCFRLFEFQHMPFGLKNALAAYCRLVQAAVNKVNNPGLSTYLEDVILLTCDPDAHVDLLDWTLEAHYQSGINLKAKKTILFESAVDYLGFKVDQDGIKMTDKYVANQANQRLAPTQLGERVGHCARVLQILQVVFTPVCCTNL